MRVDDIIQKERIQKLNDAEVEEKDFVLYWMQHSQREEFNPALEYSIKRANELDQSLIVYFGLTDDFPEANLRHYRFMLEGLKETQEKLKDRGIQFVVKQTHPPDGALELSKGSSLTVTDRAYLPLLREWRKELADRIDGALIQVEGDAVVPVEEASEKEEYAARTLRPKINEQLDKYMKDMKESEVKHGSLDLDFEGMDLVNTDIEDILSDLDVDEAVDGEVELKGGTEQAKRELQDFIDNKLDRYSDLSNDPGIDVLSNMSPYLHFGQISPVYVARKVKEADKAGTEDYLEQLIVRRELALNFVFYNEDYDTLACLPEWARETLKEHEDDEREYVYSREEFEEANTHDPYWNAAQMEMVTTGKMHGYMRMYWGKKILEWSETPEKAYETALYLNNKYELDGRDPNGYTGVAWCFGKHDQGWKEREVYGKVRYMNANGLERKFDMDEYLERVKRL